MNSPKRAWMGASVLLVTVVAVVTVATRHPLARSAQAPPAQDWPVFGGDVAHLSGSTASTGITAANVAALKRRQVTVDGIVDASAIYLHGVPIGGRPRDAFFVTTTYGRTVAIGADDGAVLWTFTPPGLDTWINSRQITNSTPVADPGRQFIYAASPDGHVEKLAIADGRAAWSTAITRLPAVEKIASPLTFFRGHIIAVTGGYIGDRPPYQGHVAILDAANGALLHVWNSLCSDRHELIEPASCPQTQSAIWGRAGAVIDAGTGEIFVATGNGPWDGRTAWGDATIELDPDATRMIGNYTPTNNQVLNQRDLDVGSTSPVLLGGGYVAQGGKDGTIRLLTTQMMKGTEPHLGGELQVVETPSGAQLLTAPAVLHAGAKTWLFAADRAGTAAWTFEGGKLVPAWRNTTGGTSPLAAGGLLYVYNPLGGLAVYDPESGRLVTTLECGSGHWNSPIAVDGRIALPEGNANGNRRGGGPAPTTGVLDIWSR